MHAMSTQSIFSKTPKLAKVTGKNKKINLPRVPRNDKSPIRTVTTLVDVHNEKSDDSIKYIMLSQHG